MGLSTINESSNECSGNVLEFPGYRVFYACQKGKGHVIAHKPCQDATLTMCMNNEILFSAVADGHGGDKYIFSNIGSKLACEILYNQILGNVQFYSDANGDLQEQYFCEYIKSNAFKKKYVLAWRKAVLEDYQEKYPEEIVTTNAQDKIELYGTTIIFLLVTSEHYIYGQLGDGAILSFNGSGIYQLFKRHAVKQNSVTKSLCSVRAFYDLQIDVTQKFLFNNILLSTDGIYDKLDTGDSFYLYGSELSQRAFGELKLDNPFTLKEVNISDLTYDDCTISLIMSDSNVYLFPIQELEQFGYTELKLDRLYDNLAIVYGEKDGNKYSLHIHRNNEYRCVMYHEQDFAECLGCYECFRIDDVFFVNSYAVNNNLRSLQLLYEYGELREKNLDFDNENIIDNAFLLNLYENIQKLLADIKKQKLFPKENFLKNLMLDCSGKLYYYDDTVSDERIDYNFALDLKVMFAIIVALECGHIRVPLFDTIDKGRIKYYLHLDNAHHELFTRLVYNSQHDLYALWNLSKDIWHIEDEEHKEILPKKILKLTQNRIFCINTNAEVLAQGINCNEGKISYGVNLFFDADRNEAKQ